MDPLTIVMVSLFTTGIAIWILHVFQTVKLKRQNRKEEKTWLNTMCAASQRASLADAFQLHPDGLWWITKISEDGWAVATAHAGRRDIRPVLVIATPTYDTGATLIHQHFVPGKSKTISRTDKTHMAIIREYDDALIEDMFNDYGELR